MMTTIAVKDSTLDLLREAKMEFHVESYDDLLRRLVVAAKLPRKSLRGAFKVKPFVREEIDRFD